MHACDEGALLGKIVILMLKRRHFLLVEAVHLAGRQALLILILSEDDATQTCVHPEGGQLGDLATNHARALHRRVVNRVDAAHVLVDGVVVDVVVVGVKPGDVDY